MSLIWPNPDEILLKITKFPTVKDCRWMLHKSWGMAALGTFLMMFHIVFPVQMAIIDPNHDLWFIFGWGFCQSAFLEAILWIKQHPLYEPMFANPT